METPKSPQIWFVTGANSGFGRVFTEFLLEKGEKVAATSRKVNGLDFISPNNNFLPLHFDMRDLDALPKAVGQVIDKWGRIDVLVNNAGYGLSGALEELTEQQIADQMNTNFTGLTMLTHAVLPQMRKQGSGYIVNFASVAGLRGWGGMSLYCASKFAVVGLTESLAQELEPFGIRASVVSPGPYRTDWAGRSIVAAEAMTSQSEASPYKAMNGSLTKMLNNVSGNQPGDPLQVVQAVYEASRMPQVPVHMLFGDEAIQIWNSKIERYKDSSFFALYPHGSIQPVQA